MGMYDELKCKCALPLPEEYLNLSADWNEVVFQTKDLCNCLSNYVITENRELLEEVIEYETTFYTKEEIKKNKIKPWNFVKEQKIKNQYTKNVDHHGVITFYGNFNLNEKQDIWLEFSAYFVYGKLDKIELIKTEKFNSHKVRLDKFFEEDVKLKKSLKYKFKKYFGWFWFWRKMSFIFNRISCFFSRLNSFAIRRLAVPFMLLATCNSGFSQNGVKLHGNVNYEKHITEDLSTKNTFAAQIKLYEHQHFILSLSNAIAVDLNCFKQEIKETLVFTTLRVDF